LKGRNWAFVMYPESMPEDWFEKLEQTGLPFAISPLHDKDLNPTGEEKKPHYHVICQYSNNTTLKNVKENVCKLVNATIPIKLESIKGMYRYHLHLDNPEKHQYDDRDRIFINGFDISQVNALTKTEIDKYKREILTFIEDNDILYELRVTDFLYEYGAHQTEYSRQSAEAVYCARNEGKFWEYYHAALRALYNDYHSKGIGDSKTSPQITDITDEYWLSIGRSIGLSDDFESCYREHKELDHVISNTGRAYKLVDGGLPYFNFDKKPLGGFDQKWGWDYVMKYLEKRAALNNCTYSYLFNRDSQHDFGRPPSHCLDIAYFFHNTATLVVSRGDEATERIERQMFGCLMAFARTGNPNTEELPEWPASTPEDEYTMFFDAECTVKHNHDKELLPLYCREMPSRFAKTLAESNG